MIHTIITDLHESEEDIYVTIHTIDTSNKFKVVKNTYTIQEYIDKYNINIFVSDIKSFEERRFGFEDCADKSKIDLINKIKEKYMEYFI